jgi:hypothetical protein
MADPDVTDPHVADPSSASADSHVDPAAFGGGAAAADAAAAPRSLVTGEIVAGRGTWFFVARCLLIPTLMVFGGLYFLYDGFIGWPGSNQRIEELTKQAEEAKARNDPVAESNALNARKEIKPRGELDIRIQKLLGFGLTPLGVFAGVWFLYRSRGSYRLTADDVLHVPGHPPVPASAVTELDKSRFDKKGIVYVKYALPDATGAAATGSITLDDFVYDQEPTDQIIDRIEAAVAPGGAAAPVAGVADSE